MDRRRALLGLLATFAIPPHAGVYELLFGRLPAWPFALRSFLQPPPDAPVIGDPAARHAVLMFGDYNCPTCRLLGPYLSLAVRQARDIKLVVMLTPIVAPTSREVARIALASAKLGQFGVLHERLLATRGKVDPATALRTAAWAGVNIPALRAAMKAPELDATLDRAIALHRANRLMRVPVLVAGSQGFLYRKDTRLDFEPLFAVAREEARKRIRMQRAQSSAKSAGKM
jgi:protein-disulfide isomerase